MRSALWKTKDVLHTGDGNESRSRQGFHSVRVRNSLSAGGSERYRCTAFSLAVSARLMHVTHQPGYGRKSRSLCSQERPNRRFSREPVAARLEISRSSNVGRPDELNR
jgi:hypothetical protein